MDSKLSADGYADYFMDVNQAINVKDEEYSCYLCNATYEKDLQLAAELGKTLLERNKELESALKNHQNVIEDQSQEIEYLTKQTQALKEVNSSRFKIYEQLEISIQDLEHANVTLSQQSAADKKQVKSLLETVDKLESRFVELQHSYDNVSLELESERRQRISAENEQQSVEENDKSSKKTSANSNRRSFIECVNCSQLLTQLQETKALHTREQRMIDDLRDQLSLSLEETSYLQTQVENLQRKEEEIKSVQEELATLEQIRSGNLCKRCLRSCVPTEDCSSADELLVLLTNEDDDVISNAYNEIPSDNDNNPYKILVEKYEALLKLQQQQQQQQPHGTRSRTATKMNLNQATLAIPFKSRNCMSLQEELQMTGGFYKQPSRYRAMETDSEAEEESAIKPPPPLLSGQNTAAAAAAMIPSSFSSSSATNKSTQTEVLACALPGSFLCKISDGNDCQFSIYDDASPIESRFRKTPEYRQLFREIFAVLKRAAEAKDEGESLPLLDDRLPGAGALAAVAAAATATTAKSSAYEPAAPPKVPPVTPAVEELPFIPPQLLAQMEKVTITEAVEEPTTTVSSAAAAAAVAETQEKPKHDVMAQLAEGVKLRLDSRNRHDKRAVNSVYHHHASPSPSPCNSRSTSKRRAGSKARKRRERLTDSPSRSRERHQQKSNKPVNIAETIQNEQTGRAVLKERPVSMFGFCGGSSSVSKEVAKLKILEKSYAEVLRMGRKKSTSVSKISIN